MQFPINYIQKGEGTPFVFQHGLGADLSQPQMLLTPLNGVTLISMDCPGHGASPLQANEVPSFDYYANQLITLLDQLKVKEAVFGGISMGSGIALNIALRFPERVKSLILVRPAWVNEGTPKNLAILLNAAKYIGQKNGKEAFWESTGFQNIHSILPNAALSLASLFDPSQRKEIPFVLEKMVEDRPFKDISELERIEKPCLIIGSQNDPLHPFEMAGNIHQKIKESQLSEVVSRYVDDDKHSESVNQLITTFITTQ